MTKPIVPFLLLLTSCSCANTPKVLDPQNAVEGNDLTTLISGCGVNQIGIGYIACRLPEGSNTKETFLFVHAPTQVNCDENSCVKFKVFIPRESGRSTYAGEIKKGESFTKVSWFDITDKETLDISDRGFYGVSVTITYRGPGGEKLKTYTSGYVFMHVVRKDYVSLIENPEDENYVWEWKTPTNQTAKMTTGGRVFVSPYIGIQKSWLP